MYMKCGKCGAKINQYAIYCRKCQARLEFPVQIFPMLSSQTIVPTSVLLLFLPPLHFIHWAKWVNSNIRSINSMNIPTNTSGSIYKFILYSGITLVLSSLIFSIYLSLAGRISDTVFIPILVTSYILLMVWGLLTLSVYLSTNSEIYKKLKFFLESNPNSIPNKRLSFILSTVLGHTYFQYKINDWRRFVQSHPPNKVHRSGYKFKLNRSVFIATIGLIVIPIALSWVPYLSPTDARAASFAVPSDMNYQGRQLYFSASPKSVKENELKKVCQITETELASVEYGCYVPNSNRIFLLNMEYTDFLGIEPSIAAHEMLHHAYHGLSLDDKAHVNKLLNENLTKLKASGNTKVSELLSPYADLSETAQLNELHSLLSTMPYELLSKDLNEYYSRYFINNRTNLIASQNNYELQVKSKIAELEKLKESIDSQLLNIDKFELVLTKQKSSLDYYAYSGNSYAYNNLVTTFNTNIDNYKKNINIYNTTINDYNVRLDKYNTGIHGRGLPPNLSEEQNRNATSF